MEDGDISHTEVLSKISSDDVARGFPNMANYPELEVSVIKNKSATETGTKVNGESEGKDDVENEDEEDESTDEDALVIDEECKSQKKVNTIASRKRLLSPSSKTNFRGFKKRMLRQSAEAVKIVNDCINAAQLAESERITSEAKCDNVEDSNRQGELDNIVLREAITKNNKDDTDNIKKEDNETHATNDHKSNLVQKPVDVIIEESTQNNPPGPKSRNITINKLKTTGKKLNKKTPSSKLTEYAQYLGLQPTVKFKCYKCSESSFPSMSALNDHQQQCLAQPPTSKPNPVSQPGPASATIPSTNFRVTRKVYLCSACGTYYENWNLFLHMREVHRRFICLYCLGMFSLVEKLSQHLVAKHNCVPSHYLSAEDYLSTCKEACFLMCCHCERVFTEQDNFFDHVCTERATTSSEKACWSCGAKGTAPHLPSCKASIEQPSTSSQKSNKALNQKSANQKQSKITKKTPFANIEHVTADSPSKPISPRHETEQTCDIANLCTVDMEAATIKSEPMSPEKSPRERSPSFSEEQREEAEPDPAEEPEKSSNENENYKEMEEKPNTPENVEHDDHIEEHDVPEPIENDAPSENAPSDESENEKEQDEESEKPESDHENDINQGEINLSEPEEPVQNENNETPSEHLNESDEKDADSDGNMETKINTETNETESVKENDDQHSLDLPLNTDDKERNVSGSEPEMELENNQTEASEEIRRVPKVTLKLPPPGTTYSDNESDDSEKLTMEVEENEESEQEQDYEESQENENVSKEAIEDDKPVNGFDDNTKNDMKSPSPERTDSEGLTIAGDDISIVELELEQPLDKFTTENLLKTCLGATIPTCIYCNHARKIAVNGKQLGLHAIAEHRFAATVNSITAEELIPHNFVVRIKDGLSELEDEYFNLEKKTEEEEKDEKQNDITFKREYECFQCRYVTAIHKELYLHNRKMHAKTILLCIICKSNFYSYSELICHLCPGNYDLNNEMKFRCCMCDIADLPSAFRLMVHLRKRHHTCDVCLEGCINQSRLSNHVWKHKLHHLCYRCGIAYRNKPDITKHLFWKHGTESVLCKKCLQKKWPHVYHFCIPPTAFVCEECSLSFSRAVYLKVHKRLHSNEKKHFCTEENCTEAFISKKLLLKHDKRHREPDPIPEKPVELMNGELTSENDSNKPESLDKEISNENKVNGQENATEEEEKKPKNIIDVYDLPALNLSESDSDESEDEKAKSEVPAPSEDTQKDENKTTETTNIDPLPIEPNPEPLEEEQKPVQIVDGIWDNFKQYQATIEKRDGLNIDSKELNTTEEPKANTDSAETVSVEEKLQETEKEEDKKDIVVKDTLDEDMEAEMKPDISVILVDHDYCVAPTPDKLIEEDGKEKLADKKDDGSEMDHDYCTVNKLMEAKQNVNLEEVKPEEDVDKKKTKSVKKKNSSSSDSSSDSDSSSCTCGSNCSCSSSSASSSSSSSSSDSDSSSSEGKRRIAARRERRKERAKRKKESETSQAASNNSAVDVVATEDNILLPPVVELPIEESDLDTEETETDEDFYDEHPQRLANKLLEEKRNQLMFLAGVTPPVTNGSIVECSRPSTPSIPEEVPPKRKIKSKKRKKKSRSSTPKQEIPLNIPNYHNHQQSPLATQSPITTIPVVHRPTIPSPIHHSVSIPPVVPRHVETPMKQIQQTTGSGSETDSNVRSSKRRRVPNKFYGYSSDDETTDKPPLPPILKWRKADLPSTPAQHHVTATPKFVPPLMIKNIPSPAPVVEPVQAPIVHHTEVPESDSEPDDIQPHKSSSDSSDSNRNDDSDSDGQLHISQPQFPPVPMPQVQRTNENLYCYCQCPYDEVSEMIACDGRECAIEWFHFECVGIMVPPKGKWFCPDCRKKSTLRNDFIQT